MSGFSLLGPGTARGVGTPPRRAPQVDAERFLKRFDRAKAEKDQWRSLLEEIYRYFMPNRDTWTTASQGNKRTQWVLDSTAPKATQRLAGRLQSTLVPAFRQWGKLVAGSEIPKDERSRIDELLEEQTEILFDHLDASNFAMSAHESFFDLVAGTGSIICNEGDLEEPLEWAACPLRQLVVAEGKNGTIENNWREHELPLELIQQCWPGMRPSPRMMVAAQNDETDKKFRLVEGTVYDGVFRDYVYAVVAVDEKHVCVETTLPTSQFITFRWAKSPGESLGRGPAMDNLPTVRTVNAVMEFTLQNAQMAIAPPLLSQADGIINPTTFMFHPGGINYVESVTGVREMETNHRFDVSNMLLKEMQEQIGEGMFSAQFGPPEGPVKSATELLIRNKELMEDIGSSFTRLSFELQFKIVRRATDVLVRRGKMAPVAINGKEVAVRYVGPLAQAQDQSDVISFQQYWELMTFVNPNMAMLATKIEDVGEYLADRLGVPQSLLRGAAEKQQLTQMSAMLVAQMAGGQQQVAATPVAEAQPAPGAAAVEA